MDYYYTNNQNEVLGPISDEQLHSLYRTGQIKPDTNVFAEGSADWCPYHTISALPPPPPRNLTPVLYQSQGAMVPAQARVAVRTRTCPYCDEEIAIAAKKCKHCGETLDVALRAAEEAKRHNPPPIIAMNAGGASANTRSSSTVVMVGQGKSGLLAAILNLFIPGLGYIYCGRPFLGILSFFLTLVIAVLTAGIGLLVLYPILFLDGFLAAGRANRRTLVVVNN